MKVDLTVTECCEDLTIQCDNGIYMVTDEINASTVTRHWAT